MTRVIRLLVHNWPLKLAALGLATLLYGGLVFSQSSQRFDGVVPVEVRGQAPGTFLLTQPDPVTRISYLAPSGIRPITSTFVAWIDLTGFEAGGGPKSVPVHVRSIDDRISVIGSEPDRLTIDLDKRAERTVPVVVPKVAPPENMELGPTTVDPTTVTISGPASVLARVVEVRANVLIQSGIDVDQDVNLVPVDVDGNAVAQVNIDPTTARVKIPVFSNKESKTLTISPLVTGDPAPGFELIGATANPQVVTVEGDIDNLQPLLSIDTAPVTISGLSSNQTFETTLALPDGVVALDVETVQVSIKLRAVTATRTYQVGVTLLGARQDRTYTLSTDRVLLTVGGSTADLDRLVGSALVVTLDVTGVSGTASVPVNADLPAGVAFVSASPDKVGVTVTATAPAAPAGSPPPASGGSVAPSASPGG